MVRAVCETTQSREIHPLGDANRYYVAEHEGHTIEVEIRPASVFHLTRIAALFIDNRRVEEVHYGPGWFSLRGWLKGEL